MVKNTKNIFKILLLSGTLLTTGACSDSFLQTDSPNQPSQSTYWQTESDALMALTACYDAMQSRNLQMYVIYNGRMFFNVLEC